ncbi:hypothetical protein CK203_046361 [Vitis vinifera]|uniref:Reverse transcriptase domain-containing protein n=1 Tax=Vitis vinifera TaxID=29760 RepID=A0A438FW59_VITVI|nr:hypothetical protein CK203_046361 [Vitis vinifera]
MEGLDFNRIGDEEVARLEEVFSEEEVFSALSDLNGDKAPGPDGFLLNFWQFCWDFVKEEVMGFLKEFQEHGRFVRSLNSTFLVLIPKKVVSSAQNAFVEGRQILDVALIANEYGFWGEVDWVDFLVHLYSIVFCLGQWHSDRLLQQFKGAALGGPLSPYLFVVRMEALSRLILRAVGGGFLSGCRVNGRSGDGALVSHLLFADNTLVFCEASEDQMVYLSWLLMWFEAISGFRINLDKNENFSVGIVENMEALALEAGCKVGRLPSSYLGILLGANHKFVTIWDGVEERFRRRLTL